MVGEASDGDAALVVCERLRPDVVLLDVVMPGTDGITVCRELRGMEPAPVVLMLTSYGDEQAVASSVLAGASGYLLKNVSRQTIVDAIRRAWGGERLIDPVAADRVATGLMRAGEEGPDPLTARENEVLARVARGLTNRQIAAELCISEKTARNHLSRILDKLSMERRSQAAAYAVRKGLVDPMR